MQNNRIETNAIQNFQAWIFDAEMHRAFYIGFVLGVAFICGPS